MSQKITSASKLIGSSAHFERIHDDAYLRQVMKVAGMSVPKQENVLEHALIGKGFCEIKKPERCGFCGLNLQQISKLAHKVCHTCHQQKYCSRDCRLSHWDIHRLDCH